MIGRLAGKVAVITGTATGIGRETALLFAAEGATVVALDKDGDGNASLGEQLGERADVLRVDVADAAAVAAVALAVERRHPRVDVLVNNAGAVDFAPLEDAHTDHWDRMMDVNQRSAFALTRGLLGALARSPAGAVVNNASVDGLFGHPSAPVYSVAKAGVIAMTRALAYELGARGIRVNCVAPGGIATAMTERFAQPVLEELERLTPLRRWGRPEEVARAILFLASDDASFVSGTTLTVDGGRTAVTTAVLGPNPLEAVR
jgi:NAD(P)-dependent dehydrogenase (short-subunit alcohol dehydrogenase family)